MPLPANITILYGTETGNAEDYAHFLYKRLQYQRYIPTLTSLDAYPLKKLVTDTEFLIIICSTTGQGELPRNAKKFMKFILRKKLPHDLFNHLHLTTFGLGDKSYPKFNYAIKKIHTRLVQLGCQELSPRCEADEMAPEGIDGFYTEWESALIEALSRHFPNLVPIDDHVLLPPENPVVVDVAGESIVGDDKKIALSRTVQDLRLGSLRLFDRITAPDHFQDVRHVVIESQDLDYVPGDTVALYPANSSRHVELLFELQPHWLPFADKPLIIKGQEPDVVGGLISSENLTLRTLITHHLDLVAIPNRSFFMTLWHFTDESTEDGAREKEKLWEFSRFEDSEELYNYANRPRRLILECIMEFEKNTKIPVEYVYDLFPKIKPRLFLIASQPASTTVELAVAIVEYRTKLRRIRRGLCTTWLKSLAIDETIVFSIHKSNLNFHQNVPVLMIAPGTGIAPMKSLIEALPLDRKLYLFFGNRNRDKDYLFGKKWGNYPQLQVFPCFSRDGDKIKYVQHSLFANYQLVGDLIINENAVVFLCGSSGKMPREVRITLIEILAKHSLGEKEAQRLISEMEDNGRYIQETW